MSRKCKDPSKEATRWQDQGDYKGIDVYKNRKLKKGTILHALYPNADTPPSYAVTYPTVRQNKGNAIGYHEALQVKIDPDRTLRTQVRAYYVDVAYGRALANNIHGRGGGMQFFIPEEFRNLLIPGKVRCI